MNSLLDVPARTRQYNLSSLEKAPIGVNQPFGVIVGGVPIFPALIHPIAFPFYAIVFNFSFATATIDRLANFAAFNWSPNSDREVALKKKYCTHYLSHFAI